jgi:hypothetical protein
LALEGTPRSRTLTTNGNALNSSGDTTSFLIFPHHHNNIHTYIVPFPLPHPLLHFFTLRKACSKTLNTIPFLFPSSTKTATSRTHNRKENAQHISSVQFSSPLLRKEHKSPLLFLSVCLCVCVFVSSSSTSVLETRKHVSQYYWQQKKKKKKKKKKRPRAIDQRLQHCRKSNSTTTTTKGKQASEAMTQTKKKRKSGAELLQASKLTAAATKTLQNTKENPHCSLSQSKTRRR